MHLLPFHLLSLHPFTSRLKKKIFNTKVSVFMCMYVLVTSYIYLVNTAAKARSSLQNNTKLCNSKCSMKNNGTKIYLSE